MRNLSIALLVVRAVLHDGARQSGHTLKLATTGSVRRRSAQNTCQSYFLEKRGVILTKGTCARNPNQCLQARTLIFDPRAIAVIASLFTELLRYPGEDDRRPRLLHEERDGDSKCTGYARMHIMIGIVRKP